MNVLSQLPIFQVFQKGLKLPPIEMFPYFKIPLTALLPDAILEVDSITQ